MSASKQRKPVTGDDSLLQDLHKVFGGTIVPVDQRIDDVRVTTAKHGDVEGCTIVLNDMCSDGFDFTLCEHFLDVRKAAYALWDQHEVGKGYKAKTSEALNVLPGFLAPAPPSEDALRVCFWPFTPVHYWTDIGHGVFRP